MESFEATPARARELTPEDTRTALHTRISEEQRHLLSALEAAGGVPGSDWPAHIAAFNEAQVTLAPMETTRRGATYVGKFDMLYRSLLVSIDENNVVTLKDSA